MKEIITLIDLAVGDNNNARGIQRAIEKLYTDSITTELSILNPDNLVDLISQIQTSPNQFVICAAGSSKLPILFELKQILGNKIYIIWSSHQIPSELPEYATALDLINLPQHVINSDTQEALDGKLIATIGVPHNVTLTALQTQYEQPQFSTILSPKKKI